MVEASPEPVAAAGGGASGTAAPRKGKSCKGCLYYSSVLKSRGYNPICVGIPRSIPQVPNYVVDEPKEEATAQGHDLRRFRYGCAGYSMFVDNRDGQGGESEGKTLLPYCRGLEGPLVPKPNYRRSPAPPSARRRIAAWAPPFVRDRRRPQYVYAKAVHLVGFRRREDRSDQLLVDSRLVERKPSTAEQAPAHVAKDAAATTRSHQQGQQRPANLSRQEFLERFKRSAGLVASGVAKNLNKTAHYIKENIQDILYPDRRPPK